MPFCLVWLTFVLEGGPWHSHALNQTRSDFLCYYFLGDPGLSLFSYTPGTLVSCYDVGEYPNLGFWYDDYDYPYLDGLGGLAIFAL